MTKAEEHDFGIKGREYSTGIRLPAGLAIAIKRRAHMEYRTFNSLLVLLLHEALKKPTLEEAHEELKAIKLKLEIIQGQIETLKGGKK